MSYPSLSQRKKNRLIQYDYSQNGHYYVTICTHKNQDFFGEIKNEKMMLNEYGNIVKQQWEWIEKQYAYIYLDEWVIMPNHMHGIIVIDRDFYNGICRDRSRPVPTIDHTQKIKSLSEIIGAFKTTSSKYIHQNGCIDFQWHRSFHDRIIRNEIELHNIRTYIQNNPMKYTFDHNYEKTEK